MMTFWTDEMVAQHNNLQAEYTSARRKFDILLRTAERLGDTDTAEFVAARKSAVLDKLAGKLLALAARADERRELDRQNVSIRLSFQVPELHTAKNGRKMLKGLELRHKVVSNAISALDFLDDFKCDANKVAQEFIGHIRKRFVETYGTEWVDQIQYRGVSVLRHEVGVRPEENNPNWI